MSLDDIYKRRALRLKAQLTENGRPKPGYMSSIYPAKDHEENSPHVVKTHSSIPGFNSAEGEPELGEEKPEKQQDEPGPTKSASFSQPAADGESSMVPEAHKRAAIELGTFGENRSEQFIKRCVELITGVKKIECCDNEMPPENEDSDEDSDEKPEISGLSAIADKFSKPEPEDG